MSSENRKKEKNGPDPVRSGFDKIRRAGRAESLVGRYLHLGLTFTLSILLFLYVGYRLDGRLGTLPLFTLIGTFLGAGGGFLYIYRELITGRGRNGSE